MEIRLNKLISDSGLCSRREADRFIGSGRVTVNGVLPEVGQKVTEHDIVMLDDIRVQVNKRIAEHSRNVGAKTQDLVFGEQEKKEKSQPTPQPAGKIAAKPIVKPATKSTVKPVIKSATKSAVTSKAKKEGVKSSNSKSLREGKYVKYNKYAAARRTSRTDENEEKPKDKNEIKTQTMQKAMQPKFGKSVSRSAVAQRMAASPKSAALRKTSKNNPLNKAKRTFGHAKPKGK